MLLPLCSATEITPETLGNSVDLNDESITELFVATLDCIRDSAGHAIKRTCDFLGKSVNYLLFTVHSTMLCYLFLVNDNNFLFFFLS